MRRAGLELLAESAAQPGFVRAAARFVAELERSRRVVEPARFTRRCRAWAGDGPRRRYAEEVAAIYRGYRDGLEAAGLADPELFAWRALDALRGEPAALGRDAGVRLRLRRLRRAPARRARHARATAAAPTSSCRCPSRRAGPRSRRSRACTRSCSRSARASRSLPPLDDHYAPEARAALHHVERSLFEDEVDPVDAGSAIEFHSAAGQRAEIELAGARAARPAARGRRARRHRRRAAPARATTPRCWSRCSAPTTSRSRSTARCRSGTPGSAAACSRWCAAPPTRTRPPRTCWPGCARPGCCASPGSPTGSRPRCAARAPTAPPRRGALWESEHWKLDDLDRLRAGAAAAPPSWPSWSASWSACSPLPTGAGRSILRGPELDDPRVFVAARDALAQLRAVVEADPRTRLEPERVLAVLRELRVHLGEPPQPDRVQVAKPEAIRARRFHAVFVCGLAGGRVPGGRGARAVPARRGPARDRHGQRPAAAGPRGSARPRALPLLPLLLARRAAAGAVVAVERRGGQPAVGVVLRRGRARPARAGRRRVARARCPTSPGAPRRRPPPPSWSGRWRRPARAAASSRRLA